MIKKTKTPVNRLDGKAGISGVGSGQTLDPTRSYSALEALLLPLVLSLILVSLSFSQRVQSNSILIWSFWGAASLLGLFSLALFAKNLTAGSRYTFQRVLRPQHYVQASVQLTIFIYWGYYWEPIYDHGLLILAQLIFAYGFDMLLCWLRRESYVLGFGPFPIIFSINLFLWFRDDWFYLQFLMIAIGFLGKEYFRWQRDKHWVHIFNPSAFALGLFSLILIITGTTDLTWGQQIASTLTLAPYIYTVLFLTGLVVMYFFSITLIAMTAAIMLFSLSALYSWFNGIPYFVDSEIPAAVFLGLHLLITDPSTSPRTVLGKMLFGGLYGLGVFALYSMLSLFGAPTFYDKLLCVPLLNVSVILIDRWVRRSGVGANFDLNPLLVKMGLIKNIESWRGPSSPTNVVFMSIWIIFFAWMFFVGGADGKHRGDSVPFWQQACNSGNTQACKKMIQIERTYCGDNSPWACNELGHHFAVGEVVEKDLSLANDYFSKSCGMRFQAACLNLLDSSNPLRGQPGELDLRLMLREGGRNRFDLSIHELYQKACEHGWSFACGQEVSSR
ncbi:hypothetical protein NBRC116493_31760 [Aurantivibrio infirmus]